MDDLEYMDAMEGDSLAACILDWNGDLLEVPSMSLCCIIAKFGQKKKQRIML